MNTTKFLLVNPSNHLYDYYLKFSLLLSGIFSLYIGLEASFKVLLILVFLDSLTRIHATAKQQNISFNPFKKAFWLVVKSKGLRLALNKLIMQYGIYFILAFVIDKYILEQMTVLQFQEKNYTLPIVVLWVCSGIEVWSIGENIEDAGGVNLPKRLLHFLDEKYQKIFKKSKDNE